MMRRLNLATFVVLAGVVVVGTVIGLLLAGSPGGRAQPQVRARTYLNVDACLLTGLGGVSGKSVAPVWDGMRDASLSTHVRVSYLQVSGPPTMANALPYLGTLLVQNCKVVVAVGDPERSAVLKDASRFTAVRFVIFGGAGPSNAPANVTVLAYQPADARSAVTSAVSAAVG